MEKWDYDEFAIWLVSEDVTVTYDDMFGIGHYIYIELYTSPSTGLTPGTYSFSDNGNPQTFSDGVVGINYNFATDIGNEFECVGGTVKISQNGDIYTFEVSFTLENGKIVNAYYEGSMIFYDYFSSKSQKRSGIKKFN